MQVRDTNFITLLAEICEDLHTGPKRVDDLHVRDLLHEYLRRLFPATQLQEHHLEKGNLIVLKVRNVLIADGFSVVPVNERFFVSKRKADDWPHNEAQAQKAIARGSAKSVGLHFHTGEGDLIWQVYRLSHIKEGATKYANNVNAVIAAMDKGTVTVPVAGRILNAAQRRLVIEDQDAVKKAIKMAEEEPQLEIEG